MPPLAVSFSFLFIFLFRQSGIARTSFSFLVIVLDLW
jgi:hypothetical protein